MSLSVIEKSSVSGPEGFIPADPAERRWVKHRCARYVRATSSRRGGRSCMIEPRDGNGVRVRVDGEGHSHISGLKRCASPWSCPVCSPVIRRRRADELTRLVEAVQARGGCALLVTPTMPHGPDDALRDLLTDLQAAWRAMWAGRWADDFREAWGIVGSARAIEVTWGARSGWHAHAHAIVMLDETITMAEVVEFWAPLLVRWQDTVEKITGRRPDSLACLDVRPVVDARNVSEYVVDAGGWTIGAELAAGPVKLGRASGRWSPFSLLAAAACWGDADAARLWHEYEDATAKRKAIVVGRGLLDEYGVDQADEEDAAEGDEAENVLGETTIDVMAWAALHAVDGVAAWLTAVEGWAVAGAVGPPPDPYDVARAVQGNNPHYIGSAPTGITPAST